MTLEDKMVKKWSSILNQIPGQIAHGRIENPLMPGTPDYMYTLDGINGWIEFKICKTILKNNVISPIKHWNTHQRRWFLDRTMSPTCFLAVRFQDRKNQYFKGMDCLFRVDTVFHFEGKTIDEIIELACFVYEHEEHIDLDKLKEVLKGK